MGFRDIGWRDVPQVRRKNASLGETLRELGLNGRRAPNGFADEVARQSIGRKTHDVVVVIEQRRVSGVVSALDFVPRFG